MYFILKFSFALLCFLFMTVNDGHGQNIAQSVQIGAANLKPVLNLSDSQAVAFEQENLAFRQAMQNIQDSVEDINIKKQRATQLFAQHDTVLRNILTQAQYDQYISIIQQMTEGQRSGGRRRKAQ